MKIERGDVIVFRERLGERTAKVERLAAKSYIVRDRGRVKGVGVYQITHHNGRKVQW